MKQSARARRCFVMRHQDERVCGICGRRYDIDDAIKPVCPRTGEPMP